MAVGMMAFMHLYMKFTQPLFVQGLMGLKNLYEAKPVQIHLFGKPAEGELKVRFIFKKYAVGNSYAMSHSAASIQGSWRHVRYVMSTANPLSSHQTDVFRNLK